MRKDVRYAEPPSFEKFHRKRNSSRPGRSTRPKKKPSFDAMVEVAQRRIIAATQRIGHGFILAENPKEAVAMLRRWVRADDGRIGRGNQVYKVLSRAFYNLMSVEAFEYEDPGYRLHLA